MKRETRAARGAERARSATDGSWALSATIMRSSTATSLLVLVIQLPTAATLQLRACAAPRMAAEALSFEQALEQAPSMCAALQRGEVPEHLDEFVSTSAGARGFFVHYLTGDEFTCADAAEPPSPLMLSLEESASAETVEIMLMNVVMSAGTAILHDRAGNAENAESSRRTSARASILVKALVDRLPSLQTSMAALGGAVAAERGREVLFLEPGAEVAADEKRLVLGADTEEAVDQWIAFLDRWKYDQDQLEAIEAAVQDV